MWNEGSKLLELEATKGATGVLPETGRKKVLVIEDHSSLNYLLGIRLRHEGFEVSSAFDGIEGLERALSDGPDLIVLDLGLPKLSGADVLRQLRSHPAVFEVPVVILTGRRDYEVPGLFDEWCSVRRVFHKPTPSSRIVRVISTLLES
ncbi:MAG: response regulator transcription factor [Planctomycetota bacterium JB042]